jgi:hypothetical protein
MITDVEITIKLSDKYFEKFVKNYFTCSQVKNIKQIRKHGRRRTTKVEEGDQLSHLVDTFLQPPSADRYAGVDGPLQIFGKI